MDEKTRTRRLNLWTAAALAALAAIYIGALAYSRPRASGELLRYDRFVDLVETDRVVNAEILDRDGIVVGRYLTGDDRPRDFKVNYFNSEGVREELTSLLVTNNVPTTINKQFSKSLIEPVTFVVPSMFFLVVICLLYTSPSPRD